jgi:poly(beta-D-mannuronate) lyase
VDHCYFTGQTHTGNMMVVWFATPADGTHLVDHNHFANKPRLGWNGGEVIRIGDSRTSMHVSRTVVEHNYFEACNGEVEIISNKSCENVYRYNTFVNCEGALTLRHGNRCTVEGNFFFGKHKRLTGGVRVIGEEHRVFNNYFCELGGDKARSAVSFMDGIVNSPLDGYFQVKNALITFNTFVDCASAISIGISHEGGTLPPENCVFANNVVVGKKGPLVQLLEPAAKLAWQGNIMFGAEVGIPSTPGIKVADPRLALGGGLWRPAKDGPAVGAAEGDFPFITEDIEGCPRGARKDVGCFQASGAPPTRRPLTPADVGPDWMREGRQ